LDRLNTVGYLKEFAHRDFGIGKWSGFGNFMRLVRLAYLANAFSAHHKVTVAAGPSPLPTARAIQTSRMALIVGASTYDRLFSGTRFDELDGCLLYVYARCEDTAAEIEDDYSLHIATIATGILKQEVEVVLVLPRVLQ
jgi:hypothetical protein